MDFSNIRALLNKTVATGLGDLLHGVELGNELIKGYVHADQMATDFKTLSEIIKTVWSGRPQQPIIAGADEIRNMPTFLKAVGPGVLTAATFHMYGNCGHDPAPHHKPFPPVSAPGFALQPLCLDNSNAGGSLAAYVAQVKQNAPAGTKAFIGECALTGGGGVDRTTNAFVSSMWYADWLANAAMHGVSAVFRETLMGGYYEIVNKTTYLPNPDAFTMSLFSHLMGPKVLRAHLNITVPAGASTNASQMLRGYAHCTRAAGGGATVLLINLGSDTEFTISFAATEEVHAAGMMEWHLTAPMGDIHAQSIELNGELLALEHNNTAMPLMAGKPSDGSASVSVGAASVVFVQLPAAMSPSGCQ